MVDTALDVPHSVATERETGCWSHNAADGYAWAIHRCLGNLEDAVTLIKQNLIPLAQTRMKQADSFMNEANLWFNQANNEQFRMLALIKEVKALRSGTPVTYPDGNDPTDSNWKLKT